MVVPNFLPNFLPFPLPVWYHQKYTERIPGYDLRTDRYSCIRVLEIWCKLFVGTEISQIAKDNTKIQRNYTLYVQTIRDLHQSPIGSIWLLHPCTINLGGLNEMDMRQRSLIAYKW